MRKLLLWAAVLFLLTACQGPTPVYRREYILDTICSVTLYNSGDTEHLDAAFARCYELEALLSCHIPGSDIDRLNKNPGVWLEIAEETYAVLEKAVAYAELSNGLFDITIGGVSRLWDFTGESPVPPDGDALRAALATVGIEQLHLAEGRALLTGGYLDLGGLAKGYIAEALKETLLARGVTSALIDLGGDIVLLGGKPGDFRIAIAKPFTHYQEYAAELSVRDCAVVTTGVDERGFAFDNTYYHHILDVFTGYPIENGLVSVTVLCGSGADGDALSTVFFVLGLEDGLALAERLEGVEAVFITDDGEIVTTSGIGTDIPVTFFERNK